MEAPWGWVRKGGSGSRARGRAASLRARRAAVTAALLPPAPCSSPAAAPPADPAQAGASLAVWVRGAPSVREPGRGLCSPAWLRLVCPGEREGPKPHG